jgi:hypothetical protein
VKTLLDGQTREELRIRIGSLTPNDRARWGKMSVAQMVCHLSDAYLCPLGQKQASSASGFFQRTVMKFAALKVPLPWPKGIQTRPEMEQGKGGTPPAEFARDRDTLLRVLDQFVDGLPQPPIDHPIFGPMTREDWGRWGYLHADHHLRQFGR